ncbi:MAG TPA: DUF5661 family protein [Anaerolineaceae bacterium]
MQIPDYVTVEEVQRVCRELGLSDWTALTAPKVDHEEAVIVYHELLGTGSDIPLEDFHQGLEVELEHGRHFADVNVTNNHPLLTGKIVLAHFKESGDYYRLLDVAEAQGDLHKAVLAGNADKVRQYSRKLLTAEKTLHEAELARLGA